jgi:hypothetical protein
MRTHFRPLYAALLAMSFMTLSACVSSRFAESLTASSGTFTILREALSTPVDDLRARADKGEARAQFSLSLIYQYGLRQVSVDLGQATSLRQKAMVSRGYTPIVQYIPGLKGKPGRTTIINLPRYDVSGFEAKLNQTCAEALNAGQDTPEAFSACGNEMAYREFKPLWAQAKG